jgi:hypothetical protein
MSDFVIVRAMSRFDVGKVLVRLAHGGGSALPVTKIVVHRDLHGRARGSGHGCR